MSKDEVSTGSTTNGSTTNGSTTTRSTTNGSSDWEKRKRRAEVFGDALPEVTRDERDPGEKADDGESAGERWLKAQVPPHHGG